LKADMSNPDAQRFTVEDSPTESRLDAYLAKRLAGFSRARIVQLLADGHIRVNGAVAKKSYPPEAGDVVDVDIPAPAASHINPEPIDLRIVYQDDDLVVLDKPAGIVVHPAPGHRTGTLVNALLYHVTDLSGIGGVLRPGIVHRLDKDTSGLMLVAKHDEAHAALSAQLKRREIKRVYRAASWGHLAEDKLTIDKPLARSHKDRQKIAIARAGEGRNAVTHVRRLERWQAADLLRVELETGRTHQIRVHLASIGHPVVGDDTYGKSAAFGMSGTILSWARELARRVPRQFLHAAELRFAHPKTGAAMSFESPLPPDLAAAAAWAAGTSGGA
jgi:23S rRNA pseudouridine1911/1915/1917 synthase